MLKINWLLYLLLIGNMILFSCSGKRKTEAKIHYYIRTGTDSTNVHMYFPEDQVRTHLLKDIRKFYKNNDYSLAWISPDKPEQQTKDLLLALRSAPDHGLRPEYYEIDRIEHLLTDIYAEQKKRKSGQDPEDSLRLKKIAALDLRLTACYLTFSSHLLNGRFDPFSTDNTYAPPSVEKDLVKHLEAALKEDIKKSFEHLNPSHEQYHLLKDYLQHLRPQKLNVPPVSEHLARDDQGLEVWYAKKRLSIWKGLDPNMNDSLRYDDKMELAVRQFQAIHGLAEDGKIKSNELRLLNKPVSHWISRIEANMDRMRWIHDLGKEYIMVNIPAYELKVVKREKTVLRMKVIVGTGYKKTPVFTDSMEYIVFNPTWTIPNSIVIEELLPKIKEDPEFLVDRNLKLYDGWSKNAEELDPEHVDWKDIEEDDWSYRIVEPSGPTNALGRIKFIMPNTEAIYLHDTPTAHLFKEDIRTYSHGCIRLQKPLSLAEYLLNKDRKTIKDIIDSEETVKIPVRQKIPVHIVYWSAWIDDKGDINLRNDIYNYDQAYHHQLVPEIKIVASQ